MRQVFGFLVKPVSTGRFDNRLCQVLCYACSLVVLVAGVLSLSRLGLDTTHLFLGLLLVLAVMILGIVAGTLVGPSDRA